MEKDELVTQHELLLGKLNTLSEPRITNPEFRAWRAYTSRVLERIWGSDSSHNKQFLILSREGGTHARAFLKRLIEEVKELGGPEEELVPMPIGDIDWLINLFNKFPRIARILKRRFDDRATLEINDEYDVQDLMHALLALKFEDIRPEEWTPSYAGGSSRMDFLIKQEKIVLEIKMARDSLRDADVGKQLIVDIEKYQAHPDCKILTCFVYDPNGFIMNPSGLENDLGEISEDFSVYVFVGPK